jgi:hypothetical protein
MKAQPHALLFAIAASFAAPAAAAPLNPWQAPMGRNQVSLSPMVVSDGAAAEGAFSASVGAGGGFDLNLTAASPIAAGAPGAELEVMPRWFPVDAVGVAVRAGAGATGGLSYVVPELHAVLDRDIFDLTLNAGADVGAAGSAPGFVGILAPEVWITSRISAFVELDGTVSGGVAAGDLLPGLSANIDPDGVHGVCAAIGLPLGPDAGPAYGAFWYALTFDAPQRGPRALARSALGGAPGAMSPRPTTTGLEEP